MSPGFHGYWSSIAAAFRERGYDVTIHTYDESRSLRERAWRHVRHELPRQMGVGQYRALVRYQTMRATRSVVEARPDVVVVVKGDTLGDPFWETLDQRRLPRITWLYDEIRRTRWDTERLGRSGPVATYSTHDDAAFRASGIDSRWLPLAFDHRIAPDLSTARARQVVFVGARYPDRERVLTLLAGNGLPVRAFGRDWSTHVVDRLRTSSWHRPPIPAGRDIGRADAYAVMAAAAATLNMHGDQDGFTMRTFEAAGVGAVQLVDRPSDITAVYEPGSEVLTWADDDELVDLCHRALADPVHMDRIRRAGRRRTLAEHTFDHRIATLEAAWHTG